MKIHHPVYRSKLTGKIWTTASFASSAQEAEARGLREASEMNAHEFISTCTDFASFLAGYETGMAHKADQIQSQLSDLESRIVKAHEVLGAPAI